MQQELSKLKMGMTWTTYIGSAHGVLAGAGLWQGEVWQLMGMSGMAFHFIVHKSACPSSVTVYEWYSTHYLAMDRIGVLTDAVFLFNLPGLNTFTALQADVIRKIRAAIDQGRGVVVWAPSPVLEFGIINGYDDTERIFSVIDCVNENPDPLLYDNLGRSNVPCLYVQLFLNHTPVDREKVFRNSLQYGIELWRQPHVNAQYANGRAAYDNLSGTLQTGDYNEFGLTYLLTVYADSKNCLAAYLAHIAATSPSLQALEPQAACYRKIAENFQVMTRIAPFAGPGRSLIDKTRLPEMIELVRQSRELEDQAMQGMAEILDEEK